MTGHDATGSLCECGHFESEHYAGECRHFLNPASVICACRGFITPAERRLAAFDRDAEAYNRRVLGHQFDLLEIDQRADEAMLDA